MDLRRDRVSAAASEHPTAQVKWLKVTFSKINQSSERYHPVGYRVSPNNSFLPVKASVIAFKCLS